MNISFFTVKIMIIGLFFSCMPNDEFDIPILIWPDKELEANADIRAVMSAYKQANKEIYTFSTDDDSVIMGYVISSDEGGNFYKRMIIQDSNEDPEYGLEIMIDLKSYYSKFNFGRKVFVKLAGLSIREDSGKYVLGYLTQDKIVAIPNSLIDDFIIRSNESETIEPKKIKLEHVSNQTINQYIALNNLQFAKHELGKTFAGEASDRFSGDRVIEQCENQATGIINTSTFSNFKSNLIPEGRFNLCAVLTKDFYSGQITIVLNDLQMIAFDESDRCDPSFYECENEYDTGNRIIYYEDFSDLKSSRDIEALGWINQNINFGNGKFRKRTASGNSFLQVSAYNTGEYVMEVWLISPKIDLDASNSERLSFNTKATFDDGRALTVWISNNFEEDIGTAKWELMDIKISDGSRDGSNTTFTSSGKTNLDCFDGKINIGFRYLGSDPGKTTTYDLDNILILGL